MVAGSDWKFIDSWTGRWKVDRKPKIHRHTLPDDVNPIVYEGTRKAPETAKSLALSNFRCNSASTDPPESRASSSAHRSQATPASTVILSGWLEINLFPAVRSVLFHQLVID